MNIIIGGFDRHCCFFVMWHNIFNKSFSNLIHLDTFTRCRVSFMILSVVIRFVAYVICVKWNSSNSASCLLSFGRSLMSKFSKPTDLQPFVSLLHTCPFQLVSSNIPMRSFFLYIFLILFNHIFGLHTDQWSTRYFPINIIQNTILSHTNQKPKDFFKKN